MTGTFGGNPSVKSALLARLRDHAADDTLRFGATRWDGEGGTPLGISTEGGDSADYAQRFGYPLALAGLLDPMTALIKREQAIAFSVEWVACVPPGADLSHVPERIVAHVLVTQSADRLAAPFYAQLRELHRAEGGDHPPDRRAWSDLRAEIEQAEKAAPDRSDERAALKACAAACWPLRTSSSILATLIGGWVQDATRAADPAFPEDDHRRAMGELDSIYRETQPRRDAGESVDIPAIFRDREPVLAAAFEARLERANARFAERAERAADLVLAHLATHSV